MTGAGDLDRLIRIEVATKVRGLDGHPSRTWQLHGSTARAAKATPIDGGEGFAAQQFQAKTTLRFKIRYAHDLDPLPNPSEDMRIVYEEKTYDIVRVDPVGRRQWLEITATARAEAAA